jgi:hypothetical protein
MPNPTSSATKRAWSSKQYPYKAEYNDHFETPLQAYQDISWILDIVKPSRPQHTIYDPYYCNGRTTLLLKELGFTQVLHERRDFYKDIAEQTIPTHDTLVTNPPYSDDHKKKCLDYCIKGWKEHDRAFFILMPNYVAAREYFRSSIGDANVFYLLPKVPYEYDHPEGTGHEVSPFNSLWFCCIRSDLMDRIKEKYSEKNSDLKLFFSLDELKSHHVIPSVKRPNPKQRRKRKLVGMQTKEKIEPSSTIKTTSKHRDESGKRTKQRF